MSKEHSTRFKKLPFPLRATSAFLSAVMLFTPMGASARNLPTGAQIVRGQVVINTTGKVMDVNQQSSKAIVNWQSFDIGHGYEVNVNQPSARAAMLARVIGANPSEIYGKLTANGRLYLVNPNGILFGSGAQIDVNRLIASTLNISDDNFWNGNLVFEGNSDAAVKNLGTINAESAALIARHVDNAGAINANQIGLVGASSKVTLDNFGNGGKLSIDFSALNAGEARSASVANRGVLDAGDDGEVIISAEGGRGKINVSQGVVRAGHAEFSGYNASIFSLGDVRARTVLIDPEESLVIGKNRISGTTYTDSLGRQYTSWSDRDQSDPFPYRDSAGDDAGTYEVYMFNEGGKPEGNGYRYTKTVSYAAVPTADGSGGMVIKFRRMVEYDEGIETYIASQNLTDALHGDKVGHFALNYTKGADADSDFGRIRVDIGVVVGGKSGLTLDAQNNLTVAGGFDFNNVGRLELLTDSELDAGDAVINAAGSVKVKAGVASNLQELNAVGEIKVVSDKGISIEKLTSLGDIVISGEEGNLLVGIIKGRDINVASLANSGTDALESITASGNLTVEVGSNLAVGNSQITGNADISAVTATIDSLAAQNIAVTANEATISGVNAATGDITFQVRNDSEGAKVLEATGQITAGGRFVADGHDLRIIDGDLELKTQGGVSLKSVVNDGQKATIDGGIGNVTVARAVGGTESAETVIRAGGDIAVQSVDDEGELLKLAAGGDVTVNGKYSTVASDVDVVAGNNVRINGEVISQQGHVGIAADTGDVWLNGGITAGKNVDVTAGRDVFGDAAANIAADNGGITVAAGRDIELKGSQQAKAVTNTAGNDLKVGGAITATEGDATLTAGNNLQADGDITASEGVALMAREGSVKAGKIKAGDEFNAWVHGAIDTTINGMVEAKDVTISAGTGDVRLNGGITAGKDVEVVAGRDVFGDAAANIAADNGGITVAAGHDIGLEGGQQAKAITNIAGNDLKVGGAVTATEGDATLTAGNNLQADGDITASEGVGLLAKEGSVKAGKIKAGDGFNASVHGAIDTTINGTVEAKDVTISAGTGDVRFNGEITAGKDVEVVAGRDVFGDAAANISAGNGGITVAAGRDIGLEGGQQAKAITNHAGNDLKVGGAVTAAEGDATLTAGNDARVDGAITVADADSSAVVLAGRNAVVAGAVNSKGVATINATRGSIEVSEALEGAEGVILSADKDILVRSAVASTDGSITMNSGVGKVEVLNVVKGNEIAPSTLNAKYDIFIDAKRDITLEGAQVSTEGGIKVISQSGDVKVADQTALWVWDMAREGSVNAANIDVIDGINIDAAKNITVDGNLKAENFNIMVGRWQDDEFGAPATMGDIVIRGTQEAGRQIFNWTEGGSITLGKAGDGISGKATSGGSIDLIAKGDITVEMGGLEVTGGNNAVAPSINVSTTDGDISIRGVQDARAIGGEDGEVGRITYQADSGSVRLYSDAIAFGGVSVEAGKDITTLDLASRDANIDVTSKQGDINVRGRQYAKSGDITNTAEAGDVILETVALANGTIIIEGGNVTTKALTSEEGDIIVNALDGDLLIDGTQSAKGGFMGVQNTATGSVTTRSIKSGLAISVDAQEGSATVTGDIINEGDDAQGVSITAKEDVSVIGDVKGDSGITMTAKTGNLEYQMADADADGVSGKDRIEFTAGQDLSINGNVASVEGGVQITAGRDATVEGGIVVEGEGSQIRLEAGRNAEIGASQRAAATDGMVINQAGNNLDIRGEVQADAAFMTAEHGDITVSSGITTASTSFFENLRIHAGHDVRLRSNSVLDAGKGTMVIAADTGVVAAEVSDAGARRPKLVGDSVSITGQAGVDLENAVVGRDGENETDLTTRVNITANTGDVITGDTAAKYVLVTARTGGIENRGRIKATDILRLDAHLDVDLGAVEGGSLETIVENGDIDIAQAIEMESIFLETKNGNVTSTTAGTLTATEKNVTVAAGKDVGLKGAVTAEKGDISIAAGRDARIAGEQNAAGKAEYIAGRNLTTGDGATVTADTISMTSQGGNLEIGADLTAKGDGIQVMAEAGNVEVKGRQTAENGAIVNEAAVNLAISGPVKAQVVKLAAVNGDVKISGDDTTIEATDEINGKIMVTAGHDLEITGGKNTATGAAEYTAGRNLTIDGNAAVEAASITMSAKNGNASISKSLEATDGDIVVNALNGDVAIHDIQTANKGAVVNVAGNNLFVSDRITARNLVAVQAMDGSATVDAIEVGEEGAAHVFAGMDAKLRGEVIAREVNVLAEHGDITADMAITARSGGIIAEAGRDIKVTGTQSAANGAVSNTARNNLTVEGEINAGYNITLTATEGDLELSANATSNEGVISAEAGRDAKVTGMQSAANGAVSNTARENLTVEGEITARDNITLKATEGDLELSANATSADGVISAEAGRDAKVTGMQSAANGAVSNTARNNLTVEGEITARDNITLKATEGDLELSANATSNDGVISAEAGRNADISGEQKATSGSVINHAANDLAVTGAITAGDAAQLTAQNGQILLGAAVDARNDITIEARRGDVAISGDGDLASADGDIAVTAGRDAKVTGTQTANNGTVSNTARENLTVEGDITARDNITLTATEGNLELSANATSNEGGITAEAGRDAKVTGMQSAANGAVSNTARNNLTVEGEIIARDNITLKATEGDLELSANATSNEGVISAEAGRNADISGEQKATSGSVINHAANDLAVTGGITAGDAVQLTAQNGQILLGAAVDARNDITIEARRGDVAISEDGDLVSADGDIAVTAGRDARIDGNQTAENGAVSNTARENLVVGGEQVIAGEGITLRADNGDLQVSTGEMTATAGDILASTGKGNVRIRNGEGDGEQPVAVTAQAGNVQIISGDGIDIGAQASVRAEKNVGLTARNDIGNSGSVVGRNDVMISSDSGDITNSGVVVARNNLKVKTLSGDVNNAAHAAMMTANGEIEIDAHGDVYNNGQISATGDEGAVNIKATGDVENDAQGDIYARKLVRIKANGDTTNSGSITAYDITDGEGQIVIESDGDVRNKDTGRMHADIKAEITSGDGDIDNSGLIQAGDTDPLTPGSEIVLNALKGDINSDGSLIAETVTLNARGKIDVQGDTDADHVFAHTTGVGGNIDLKLDHDVKGLSATTEGAQSDITVRARNIGNGQLVAKGEDSDIAINGLDMTLMRVTAEDGNVDISGGNLRLGTVYAHEDGTPILNGEAGDARNVRVNAAGNVYIGNTVEADANVAINASGAITGSPLASVNAGNDIDLTSGDHIGEAGNALEVNAGGDLFVNAQPGMPEREYFAFIRGTSGDGEVHSKSKKLPGLVIFNSVAWMGTAKQMSRIDRAYAHMFNLLNKELWLMDQAWPLESAYRYFPHTALYNDGYGEDLRRGYERIRLDAPAVRINGLPEGISVEGAQNAEDTFIWNFGPQAAK